MKFKEKLASSPPSILLLARAVITQQMGGAIKVDWPDSYENAVSKANFVNFSIMPYIDTSCLFPPTNFFSQLVAMTMGPIFISLLIFLYYLFQRVKLAATGAPPSEAQKVAGMCTSAFFTLSYLVFPGSSLQVFRAFSCDKVRELASPCPRKLTLSCASWQKFDQDPEYGKDAYWGTGSWHSVRFSRPVITWVSRVPLPMCSTITRWTATLTSTSTDGSSTAC